MEAGKSRNPKQPRLGFCCLTLRFLGPEWLGVSGDGDATQLKPSG